MKKKEKNSSKSQYAFEKENVKIEKKLKIKSTFVASKLYGVNATIIIFVFVLYCIVLYCIVLYCIVLYFILLYCNKENIF